MVSGKREIIETVEEPSKKEKKFSFEALIYCFTIVSVAVLGFLKAKSTATRAMIRLTTAIAIKVFTVLWSDAAVLARSETLLLSSPTPDSTPAILDSSRLLIPATMVWKYCLLYTSDAADE